MSNLDPVYFVTDSQTGLSQPKILIGTGYPTVVPDFLGQLYVVPETRDVWVAVALAAGEWKKVK